MGYQRWYSVLLLAAISNAETTPSPTAVPVPKPSDTPTSVPTSLPTPDPTGKPSRDPTSLPTSEPTTPPTSAPTKTPTTAPTSKPSIVPTSTPTYLPTGVPTGKPSAVPTFSQPPSASTTSKAAEEAIDEGSFITALDTAMAEVVAELVAAADPNVINPLTGAAYAASDVAAVTALFVGSVVITEAVVTILSTEAPTFWSDTEENMEPVIVSRRQGGVAVSDLPACGCDDDTTA